MDLVYNFSEMQDFKQFYERLCVDLDSKSIPDWEDYENLHYNADLLNEFMWYCQDDNIHFKFVGFDRKNMKPDKNYNDYKWSLIFEVLEDFVRDFPNNTIEFVD